MKNVNFNFLSYLFPIFAFTASNTFFVVSITTFIGWVTKNKLFIYVSGLLLYVFYMVSMLFSNSPFMSNQLPQSKQAQLISCIFDPFGMSAYFYQTAHLTIEQRNTELISINGILLLNRICILLISCLLLFLVTKRFSISKKPKHQLPIK